MAKNKTSKFGVADDLQYTQDTQKTQETQDTQDTSSITKEEVVKIVQESMAILEGLPEETKKQIGKPGRPKKKPEEKLRGYRYNLNLDRDLKDYLEEAAWKRRTSITQYINDLIRADMEKDAEWMKENE